MGGNEQFPRDLSDSIDDLAGFEESFRNQGLDHSFSLELTRDTGLSKNGDCIIAVGCSVGLIDLPKPMKNALATRACRARLTLTVDGDQFAVEGRGAQGLTLSHPTDIVVRKSGFISDRTLMVHANQAAADIPRSFVELLQDPSRKVVVELAAET